MKYTEVFTDAYTRSGVKQGAGGQAMIEDLYAKYDSAFPFSRPRDQAITGRAGCSRIVASRHEKSRNVMTFLELFENWLAEARLSTRC